MSKKVRVLFVCMGNICRSPTAEGVFRKLLLDEGLLGHIDTDSAGTHAYHVGEPPDRRAQSTARNRGIDLGDLRARSIALSDYEEFDLILAMDEDNYQILISQSPAHAKSKISLFMDFAPHRSEREVPDPYYGGAGGFENVFDMVEEASRGLLTHIREKIFTE